MTCTLLCIFFLFPFFKKKKKTQENVKYLPGIKLGKNVVADPDLENAGIAFTLFECFLCGITAKIF